MAEVIGQAVLELSTDDKSLSSGISSAQRKAEGLAGRLDKLSEKSRRLGGIFSIALTAPVAAFGVASVNAFRVQAKAIAAVEQTLLSTGDAVGFTSEKLQAMASELQNNSLFGDEDILQNVTASIARFGNITGEEFTRAQQVTLDLAAGMGTDLSTAARAVGRALNDPIKGFDSLSRAGITFTQEQRDQIKTMLEAGDTAGAQGFILDELAKRYDGQAEAAKNADGGIIQLQNSWGDLQEQIGELLSEFITPLAEALSGVVAWLQSLDTDTKKWVVGIGVMAAAIGPALVIISAMASGFSALVTVFGVLVPVLGAVKIASIALFTNPFFLAGALVLGAIALAVGAVYLAWKNWDKIVAFVKKTYEAVKRWIGDKLAAILEGIKKPIDNAIKLFQNFYQVVVGGSIIPDLVDDIADEMRRLDKAMNKPIGEALSNAQQQVADFASKAKGILANLFPRAALRVEFDSNLEALNNAGLSPEVLAKAVAALKSVYSGAIAEIEGEARAKLRVVGGGELIPDLGAVEITANTSDVSASLAALSEDLVGLNDRFAETRETLRLFGQVIGEELRFGLFNLLTGRSNFRDFFEDAFGNFLDAVVRKSLENLEQSLFGDEGIGGFFGNLFAGLFAEGGLIPRGQFGIVGERGPEFAVSGPSGTTIIPSRQASASGAIGGGNQSIVINFNGPVSNAEQVHRSAAQAGAFLLRQTAGGKRGL